MPRCVCFAQPTKFYDSSDHKENDFHCSKCCSKRLSQEKEETFNDTLMEKLTLGPNTHIYYDRG